MKPTLYLLVFFLLATTTGRTQTVQRSEYQKLPKSNTDDREQREVLNTPTFNLQTVNGKTSLGEKPMDKQLPNASVVSTEGKLISDEAFNRLIKQDMTFTVLGNQTPTPGFSLDLSDKLSVKVTGLIPSVRNTDRQIVTVDAEAARVGEEIPLLTEGKFTGKLSAGINLNITNGGVMRVFGAINTHPHLKAGEPIIAELTRIDNLRFNGPVLDSVAVLACYLALTQPQLLSHACLSNPKILTTVLAVLPGYRVMTTRDYINAVRNHIREDIFLKMASKYYILPPDVKTVDAVSQYLISLSKDTFWRAEAMMKEFNRIAESYANRDETLLDGEINRARNYWLHKRLHWFTFSFRPVVFTYDAFQIDSINQVSKSTKMNFLEFELPIWYQTYGVYKNGGTLFRIGVQFISGSNRGKYTNVNYATTQTVGSFNNLNSRTLNQLIAQKQVSGIWDDGTLQRYSIYTNLNLEYYYMPRQNFIPGYSIKLNWGRRGAFGNDGIQRLRLEGGLVINLLNNNKTQSAFTVQPYVAISNLMEEKIDDKSYLALRDKVNAGIRLGLPIRGQLQAQ